LFSNTSERSLKLYQLGLVLVPCYCLSELAFATIINHVLKICFVSGFAYTVGCAVVVLCWEAEKAGNDIKTVRKWFAALWD
jgi:hypothetical protein